MFKIAKVVDADGLSTARHIMEQIRAEHPDYWPYGLSADHFDGGCYLIREKRSNAPVGFTGFQRRWEFDGKKASRVGYYSIGILPAYRNQGLAKEAVGKLLNMKSATVDRMQAMIVAGNEPSMRLAEALGVPVKSASDQNQDNAEWAAMKQKHPIIPAVTQTLKYLASKRPMAEHFIQTAQEPTVYTRAWDQTTEPIRGAYHKAKSEMDKLQISQYLNSFLNRR